METFEQIIVREFTDGAQAQIVIDVRAEIAHDMDIAIMTDNCRGYL